MFGDPYLFLVTSLFLVPALVIAIPGHELGHVLVAYAQGDRSVRNRGFLKPDPRLFIEPYGALAVFLANVGWSNPAPVNEYRFRGAPGRVAYALAGPAANVVLALLFGIALRALVHSAAVVLAGPLILPPPLTDLLGVVAYALFAVAFLNVSMFAFNLLPLPGLDGWRVLEAVLRRRYARFFFEADSRRREIWVIAILVIFIGSFLGRSILAAVLLPLYAPVATLVFGSCIGYPGLIPCPR